MKRRIVQPKLSAAAEEGRLHKAPMKLLTPENLLGQTPYGVCFLEIYVTGLGKPLPFSAREWIPHLEELKELVDRRSRRGFPPLKELTDFVKKVETVKKLQELPSLKI